MWKLSNVRLMQPTQLWRCSFRHQSSSIGRTGNAAVFGVFFAKQTEPKRHLWYELKKRHQGRSWEVSIFWDRLPGKIWVWDDLKDFWLIGSKRYACVKWRASSDMLQASDNVGRTPIGAFQQRKKTGCLGYIGDYIGIIINHYKYI